jgi:hypothetical protein
VERLRKTLAVALQARATTQGKATKQPLKKKARTEPALKLALTGRQVREMQCVVADHERLSKASGWREIAAGLSKDDGVGVGDLLDTPFNRLWRANVVVYCDVREDWVAGAGRVVSHRLLALCARLEHRGANVALRLHPGVSHVVVDPAALALDPGRGERLQRRIREMRSAPAAEVEVEVLPGGPFRRYEQLVVGPAWAERCVRAADREGAGEGEGEGEGLAGGEEYEDWAEVRGSEKVVL